MLCSFDFTRFFLNFQENKKKIVKSYCCKIQRIFKYNFKRVLTPLCLELDQLWFWLFWHFFANFLSSLGESKNGFGDSCGDIRPDVRIRQWVWIWRRISAAPQKEVFFRFFFSNYFFSKFRKFVRFLLYFSRFSSPEPPSILISLSLLIDEKVARFCIKKFRLIRISHFYKVGWKLELWG